MPSLLNISKNKLKTSNNDMKGTELFKQTIKHHLDARAKADKLFSASYAKEGKNIDDCITYILTQVQASGYNGFADDEIYSMAVHYYDEDNICVGAPVSCQVFVNYHDNPREQSTEGRYPTTRSRTKGLRRDHREVPQSTPKPAYEPEFVGDLFAGV